jgi:hypothetical protein
MVPFSTSPPGRSHPYYGRGRVFRWLSRRSCACLHMKPINMHRSGSSRGHSMETQEFRTTPVRSGSFAFQTRSRVYTGELRVPYFETKDGIVCKGDYNMKQAQWQLLRWIVRTLERPKSERCRIQDLPPIVARIVVEPIVIALIVVAVVDLVLPIPRN